MNRPFIATEHIWTDGVQLIDAAQRVGLDAEVPSCDGWKMRDLIWHTGEVWNFWGWIVSERVTDIETIRSGYPGPAQPSDDFLIDWVTASLVAVHAAVSSTPLDTEVWTWTGANRDVDWVRRRMAHETAVHRWDAELVTGDPYDIPTAVAADGIDEFLQWFMPANPEVPLAGTVHLHCTDTASGVHEGSDSIDAAGGEWFITPAEGGALTIERIHAKGDTAIRGRANDLLLWLWGRQAGPVEILGDADLAAAFAARGSRD